MATTRDINYRDCPIDIDHQDQPSQRIAILEPLLVSPSWNGGLFRVIAIADRDGTFPAPPNTFYDPVGADGDHWIINGTYDECPPGRTDTLLALLRRLPRDEMLRFGRWCRARAIEYSFVAAARCNVRGKIFPFKGKNYARNAFWAIDHADRAIWYASRRRIDDEYNVAQTASSTYNARYTASNAPWSARRRNPVFHHAWMNIHDELLARVLRHEGEKRQ